MALMALMAMAGGELQAVVFDLYGTLVHIRRQFIARKLPRLLGAGARSWASLVRERLLLTPALTTEEFLDRIVDGLGVDCPPELRKQCTELVEAEIASIEPVAGVRSLLSFLKRRGFRLGLLSNLSAPHAAALNRLELRERFDAVCLSCEEGVAKPDPEIYRRLQERLRCPPGATLMVGDSLANDVLMPRSLGMRALRIHPQEAGSIPTVAALGWLDFEKLPDVSPLIKGSGIHADVGEITLGDVDPLPDSEQGRYNLVARVNVRREPVRDGDTTGDTRYYAKRFLLPEAAHVEEFANHLLGWLELPSCTATVIAGGEPCLLSTVAPGQKLESADIPDVAYEVGRHGAISYIFANGDLRPRNAFVARRNGVTLMTMVDLEQFFFNLAIDVSGVDRPDRPQTIDDLTPLEIERRLRRRVLTERTTRRAMRSFLEIESLESTAGRAFREGWLSVYRTVKAKTEPLFEMLRLRVYREPYLIIGTHSYRRAMASIDIQDIRGRAELSPDDVLPRLVAYSKRD
jgi:HAD superfamily hydrolase (TIGR01509 family)